MPFNSYPGSPLARLNAGRVGQILCSISGIVQVFQGIAITCLLIYVGRFLFEYLSVFQLVAVANAVANANLTSRWLPLTVWLLPSLVQRSPCVYIVILVLQQIVGSSEMACVG